MSSIGSSRARRLAPALVAILALAWAPAARAQETDTVMLKEGTSEGQIESEDFAGVSVEMRGGAKRNYPWADVVGISYGSVPELATAMETFSANRLDEALAQFEEIQASKPRQPVLQQVLLHKAMIQERKGMAAEALATWSEMLSSFPKGRYLRRAAEGVVVGYWGQKRAAEALPELDKVAAGAEGVPGLAAELDVLRGRVHEALNDAASAETNYKAAEAAAEVAPSVKQEAQLGVGRCLALNGKKTEAEQVFRALSREDAASHVLAGAWNGLAAKWAEEGKEKRDLERLYEALYGYLRGVVQYAPRAGEPTVEFQCALAGAAQCFRYISQLEKSAEKKRRFEDLADEHLAQLRAEFPGSPYLQEPAPREPASR